MLQRRKVVTLGLAVVAASGLVLTGCTKGSLPEGDTPAPSGATGAQLATTTPAGTTEIDSVSWALYRDVAVVDPIFVFDYPDNAAIALLCESLSKQQPDGSIVDGLATLTQPDDTTLVYTMNPKATFWDGTPVTAADAAFSLQRQANPKLGGLYGGAFSSVDSITATSSTVLTIKLKSPDYVLPGELASIPGMVVEQKYAEAKGQAFGTPDAGVMCSGAYKNSGWTVGQGMTVTRNDSYWDTSVKPKTKSIKLIAAADPTAITAGLLSGDITGIYMTGPTGTLKQLQSSGKVTVTQGASYVVDALITSTGNGVLTDPVVRKALSMAIDRPGYISAVWEGAASLPKALNPPATWGYGKDVFAAGYAALPDMTPDIAGAKALVADKGLAGKSITIAYIQLPPNAAEANAVKSAAESIGLTVKLKAVAPDAYINLFIDPEFRKGIDGWFTLNYPDYADPLSLLRSVVVPGGSQNFVGYSNPTVTQEIAAATASADPAARAAHVVAAQKVIAEELPWIPMAFPNNVNATSTSISGQTASFSYMFAGWANDLGGTGK